MLLMLWGLYQGSQLEEVAFDDHVDCITHLGRHGHKDCFPKERTEIISVAVSF